MQVPADYETALNRKYPEPVSIAIAKDRQGKYNPISLGWVMNTSHDPPMLAISVGLARYSLGVIRHARAFTLSFLASTQAREAIFHGTKSGRDMDKLTVAGTPTQPATKIDSVLLADAVANFECVLESELATGDHVIFVGRVVAAHMHADAAVRRLYTLGNEQFGGVVPG